MDSEYGLQVIREIKNPEDFDILSFTAFEALLSEVMALDKVKRSDISKAQKSILENSEHLCFLEDALQIALQCDYQSILGAHGSGPYPERLLEQQENIQKTLTKIREETR